MDSQKIKHFFRQYMRLRPIFLSYLRSIELTLFSEYFQVPENKKVLDFGCGDGSFLATLLQGKVKGKLITGLDIDATAEKEFALARGYDVYSELVAYDGGKLPFANASFDLLFSSSVMEHVADLKLNLQELSRVLKPGGKFYLTVMCAPWDSYLLGRKLFGARYANWFRRKQVHINLLSQSQWKKAFSEAGFSVESEVTYMGKSASRIMELLHFVSIPSIISHKLFGRWMLLPSLWALLPWGLILRALKIEPEAKGSAAFFILAK